MNSGYITLENGLKIIYIQDKTKFQTEARIIINYGNYAEKFRFDNKDYHIINGSAHLLEHAIIETSSLGNVGEYFKSNYVNYNGYTNRKTTCFFIKTVKDFYIHFEKLLLMVHSPNLDDITLDNVKEPIYNEISARLDRQYYNFYKTCNKILYSNLRPDDVLGGKEELKNITSDELNIIHEVFYQPKNETICLIGNFDLESAKTVINRVYNELNITNKNYMLLDKKDTCYLGKHYLEYIDLNEESKLMMFFKIDMQDFTPREIVKISFYFNYFFEYNFSDKSSAFKKLTNYKYSMYSFEKNIDFDKESKILTLTIGSITNNFDEVKEIILDTIKNHYYNEEEFELWKRRKLLDIINRNIYINNRAEPYISNILDCDYPYEDTVEDVNALLLDEYLKIFNNLDFSNYLVAVCKKQ